MKLTLILYRIINDAYPSYSNGRLIFHFYQNNLRTLIFLENKLRATMNKPQIHNDVLKTFRTLDLHFKNVLTINYHGFLPEVFIEKTTNFTSICPT